MSAPVEALSNRSASAPWNCPPVVMAPMRPAIFPRRRTQRQGRREYYRRRAAAGVGLIVSEGTTVGHKAANGYPNVPRFYGEDALAGWKQVVDAVRRRRGRAHRSAAFGTSAAFGAWAWSRTPACAGYGPDGEGRRTARCWSTAVSKGRHPGRHRRLRPGRPRRPGAIGMDGWRSTAPTAT
ncbi:hypothetical protein ACPA9J_10490 [Pseudomonas aeruginosa]